MNLCINLNDSCRFVDQTVEMEICSVKCSNVELLLMIDNLTFYIEAQTFSMVVMVMVAVVNW